MTDWWLRIPLMNVPLEGTIKLGDIELRPLMGISEAKDSVARVQCESHPFVHTADLVMAGGEDWTDIPERHAVKQFVSGRGIGQLGDAFRFLCGGDVLKPAVFVHDTPECDSPAHQRVHLTYQLDQPASDETEIRVTESQTELTIRAVNAWNDEDLDERTAFRLAAAFHHYSRREPVELAFLHRWCALETAVNRWCDVSDEAPDEAKDVCIDREILKSRIKPKLEQTLNDLLERCELDKREACALLRSVQPGVRVPMPDKLRAFLRHIGVYSDVQQWKKADLNRWVNDTAAIRNALMHGRPLKEAYERCISKQKCREAADLVVRWRQLGMLVDRFVMSLLGYGPCSWPFETPPETCRGSMYGPITTAPGEGAGATTDETNGSR